MEQEDQENIKLALQFMKDSFYSTAERTGGTNTELLLCAGLNTFLSTMAIRYPDMQLADLRDMIQDYAIQARIATM